MTYPVWMKEYEDDSELFKDLAGLVDEYVEKGHDEERVLIGMKHFSESWTEQLYMTGSTWRRE